MARWYKRELLRILPTFIFFFIALYIINLTEVFLLKKAGLSPFTLLDVFVAAALIAKIFFVVDHLSFIDWVPRRPLIYRVLWKTAIYGMVVLLVRATLRWIHFLFETKTTALAWTQFLTQVNWPLFFTIQSWFLLLLFLYVTAKELALIIGVDEIRKIFFKKR